MGDYTKLYTIIFWLSMLYILLWVVLKVTGVINTPELIELSPIITAVFGAGGFFQMMRDMKERMDKMENRLGKVEFDTRETKITLRHLDKRMAVVESKI